MGCAGRGVVGGLTHGRSGGRHAFGVELGIFTEREERKSTAVASNAPFTEWDQTFTDPRLCAAIADRLTFRAILVQTGSESYRLRATKAEHAAEAARRERA